METTPHDTAADILFPRVGARGLRAAVRDGRRITGAAEPERLKALLGTAPFDDPRALVGGHPHGVRLHLTRSPDRYRADVVVDARQGVAFLDDGVSVNLEEFDRVSPVADTWLDALARELGVPRRHLGCSAFVSPTGGGLPLHFDDKDVVVVQTSGSKRWRLAHNDAVRFPTANHAAGSRYLSRELARYYRPDAPGAEPQGRCDAVELRVGDVLFVPRGHWHGTEACAGEASVSLSFGIAAPSWSSVFIERLRAALVTEEHWRAPAVRIDEDQGHFLPDDLVRRMDGAVSALKSGAFGRALAEEYHPDGRAKDPAAGRSGP